MRFATPEFLLLLLLLPFLLDTPLLQRILPLKKRIARKDGALVFSGRTLGLQSYTSTRFAVIRSLLSACKITAFLMLTIALARPQTSTQFAEIESGGRDIILALDISGSMKALDFFLNGERVSRLDALKFVVKKFIEDRSGDRIGLVVFGDVAFTQCPLTQDANALKGFVDNLEVGMAGENTAIGDGLAVALKRIKDIESNSKVVVLVTDGINKTGTVTPREAAAAAVEIDAKIHTVGIGGRGRVPLPVTTRFGQNRITYVDLEFDEKMLREIASLTGGEYFHAENTQGLENVYKEIDELEEREVTQFQFIEYEEQYFWFAAIGAICFLLYELASATIFVRIP